MSHPSVAARLQRLTVDQRTAATAPPGPVLCVAPAGSGKTTTLVARIAWLVDGGADPATITAITFNRGAALELGSRLDAALAEMGAAAGSVRVRTFHALGREILRDAAVNVRGLVDRATVLADLFPSADAATLGAFDTAFSRLKLEHDVSADDVAADPDPGPIGAAFVAYERALAQRGGMDFDDLVQRTLALLRDDVALLARWRARCAHLLVDEVQDVDSSQLRLALLLAAPANQVFLVGDDDQSIYGWRLADVRRVLGLDAALPGLRRVDLEVNHRCPPPVVERAVRLIGHNDERFAKVIRWRPGATGRLILAPDAADEPARTRRLLLSLPIDDGTTAILARSNRELQPAVIVALELGRPFRAASVVLPLDDPRLDDVLAQVAATDQDDPLLVRIARVRTAADARDRPLIDALLAWSAAYRDFDGLVDGVRQRRGQLLALRSDDAPLSFATAHATKGAEFDHVAVVGLDVGRFPSGRAVADSADPTRALEEERRLAYVAWTRARRSLTLDYDPACPSPFLLEAFTADELGLVATMLA